MSNQHTGAPVLKGGLLQCYQLQARVYGGLALRPRQGPGLLNAAPRLPDLRRLPVRHRLLCAAATGRGRQRGGRNKREKPCFSCSPFASVYRKGCPALQVRRCICAFMAFHDKVLQKAQLLSMLLGFVFFIPLPAALTSECAWGGGGWGGASACVFVSAAAPSFLDGLHRGRAFSPKQT